MCTQMLKNEYTLNIQKYFHLSASRPLFTIKAKDTGQFALLCHNFKWTEYDSCLQGDLGQGEREKKV